MSPNNPPPVRRLLAALLVCLLFPVIAAGQGTSGTGDEQFDLVFFGREGAVFLQLNVAGAGVSSVRAEYTASVLRRFDIDGDGQLDSEEAMQLPADAQGASAARLGEKWVSLDVHDEDGMISESELFEFINNGLGAPVRIEVSSDLEQTVTVHSELDADRDGKVSRSEIENGLATLRPFDFDDDQTLSIGELQPFPTTILQSQREPGPIEAPVLALFTAEQKQLAAERLLSLYGDEDAGTIAPEYLGLRVTDAESFDANADGQFDGEELAAFLQTPVPSLALDCALSSRTVSVSRRVRPGLLIGLKRIRGTSTPEFLLAGTDVRVGASNSVTGRMSDTNVAINFYMVKFIEFDQDKNQYIDQSEFPSLGIPRTEFQAVDTDGDGMIVRQELRNYLELFADLETRATLVVTVANEGTTLFEILEASRDFRLSPRELLEGFARVREYDRNGDGALAPGELQNSYSLEISLAKPQFMQNLFNNPADTPNQQRIEGIRQPQTSGPGWFRKMDRNQDGDLSWREFFGTREDFAQIDSDGDGLIDLNEAVAADEP